jgi:hypothetical protein
MASADRAIQPGLLPQLEGATRRQIKWIACLLKVPFNRQDFVKKFPSNNKLGGLVSINQDKALHLLIREISPAAGDLADDLVLRLREFRDAKDDLLTDDEYEAFRQTVLAQIVGRVCVPAIYRVTLALLLAGCVALVGWLADRRHWNRRRKCLGWCPVSSNMAGIRTRLRGETSFATFSRLTIVERLLQKQLITENEAAKCRGKSMLYFHLTPPNKALQLTRRQFGRLFGVSRSQRIHYVQSALLRVGN